MHDDLLEPPTSWRRALKRGFARRHKPQFASADVDYFKESTAGWPVLSSAPFAKSCRNGPPWGRQERIIRDKTNVVASRQAADVEARLAEEEADQRARASEIRREQRMAKIKFMEDMDDRTEVKDVIGWLAYAAASPLL